MSRHNKVNPDRYTTAGRLSPDDLARERVRQGEQNLGGRRERKKAMPPWMAPDTSGSGGSDHADNELPDEKVGSEMEAAAGDDGGEDAGATEGGGATLPRRSPAQKRGATASRKSKRPAPRKKTGDATGTARSKSSKPTARGSSSRPAGKPVARKAKTKSSGTARQTQKKGGASKKAAAKPRKR